MRSKEKHHHLLHPETNGMRRREKSTHGKPKEAGFSERKKAKEML